MGKPGTTKMVNLGPKQNYGLKMDHGAKQMSKTDKGINYMMGAATKQMGNPGLHKKNCGYGAKQMKTGLYQDRVDGKLPENPALKQYGMDKNAAKQVGKHMAMPQMDGDDKKKPKTRDVPGYTTEGLVAGGDPFAETKGNIIEKKIDGKKKRYTVKGGSVYSKGQYVGSRKDLNL